MPTSYAPSSQSNESRTLAPQLRRLYLVDNGAEYTLTSTGPGEAGMTLNGAGEYEVDPLSTARLAKSSGDTLIVYGE